MRTSPYLRLQKQIEDGGREDAVRRWRYGRRMLADRAGRKKLPDGFVAARVREAAGVGLALSEREIQYRIQCAEAYGTETRFRTAVRDFGSWSELRAAGFPPVEPDGSDPEDLEAEGLGAAPDSWEQLQLDIPGIKPVLNIRGRQVSLVKGEGGATGADVAAYCERYRHMHENFGKTLDQAAESLRIMRVGSGGDETMNAVEAYERGLALEAGDDDGTGAAPGGEPPQGEIG